MLINKLYRNIKRFYKEYNVATPFGAKFTKADMYKLNSLMSAYEAIWESLEYYDTNDVGYKFLIELYGELRDYMDNMPQKPTRNYKKVIVTTLVIALALTIGYTIGRHHTIRQAELLDITESGYHINFGNEVHTYTFEGGNN